MTKVKAMEKAKLGATPSLQLELHCRSVKINHCAEISWQENVVKMLVIITTLKRADFMPKEHAQEVQIVIACMKIRHGKAMLKP